MDDKATGILLHPGGGGFQYPFRFRPHRPRGLWGRTPGPRPPRRPTSGWTVLVSLVAILVVVAAILIGLASDWFGRSDSNSASELSVSDVEEAGFIIERNIVDGRVRVLNGEFEGARASILIPNHGRTITAGNPEAQRAAQWLQLSGNWEALRAGKALVLCEPVPECAGLVEPLAIVVFGG